MEAIQTQTEVCPICLESANTWLKFKPCNHFSCSRCSQGWLQIKHECVQCRTETLGIDLHGEGKVLIEEGVPIPPISKLRQFKAYSDQSAAEGLNRKHFIDEFTKLLEIIHNKHASLELISQFSSRGNRTPNYVRDLELIQDAVLDSLALLGDEEAQYDPLSMHDLIYNFNQDISNVGASTNPLSQWEEDDNYYEEKAFEEDFYWYQNEVARSNNIVIGKKQKKNKKTKKNGQKVSPKDEAQEDLAGTTF